MTLETIQPFLRELDAWKKAGRTADLWWRDDRAALPCIELDRLIAASDRHGIPCGLAIFPEKAGEPLRKTVSGAAHIWVLQHHGEQADRPHAQQQPRSAVLDALRQGMVKCNQLFKDRYLSVLVSQEGCPDSDLLPYLPVMGFKGLSCAHREHLPVPPGDLRMVNIHSSVVAAPETERPAFIGAEACLAQLTEHLRAKRMGTANHAEPTGLRTQHPDMAADAWEFVEMLFELTRDNPAVHWISPAQIWPPTR